MQWDLLCHLEDLEEVCEVVWQGFLLFVACKEGFDGSLGFFAEPPVCLLLGQFGRRWERLLEEFGRVRVLGATLLAKLGSLLFESFQALGLKMSNVRFKIVSGNKWYSRDTF